MATPSVEAPTVTNEATQPASAPDYAKKLFGWEFSAEVTGGTRYYLDGDPFPHLPSWVYPLVPGLTTDQWFPYVSGDIKATHTSDDGRQRWTFEVNGRYDFKNERGQWDVPEANYYYNGGPWSVLAGIHKVFWGVAESEHLVNVINPVQYNGDPFEDDRVGQPMVNLNLTGQLGTIALYGLVGFRPINFDAAADRLPVGWVVKDDRAQYEDGNGHNFGFAARYSNTINMTKGSLDYAVSYFYGTARQPRLVPDISLSVNPPIFLVPYYDHMSQFGSELLYNYKSLQLKFEGIWRRQNGRDVLASASGFEYTLNSFGGSNMNVGLIGEYDYDSRSNGWDHGGWDTDFLFHQAFFAGTRITFDNQYNTNLLAGVSFDLDDSSRYWSADFSTRLNDATSVGVKGRFFDNIPKDSLYRIYNKQNYLQMYMTRYF